MTASVDHEAGPLRPGYRARREPRWSNHQEPVVPVAERRLSGDHWWDPDRLAHEEDMPTHCPNCGAVLVDDDGSIAVEFWDGERRTYHVRCNGCDWSGDITRVERMIGHEPPHDD